MGFQMVDSVSDEPHGMSTQEVPLGVRLFRSWLLVLGVLPVDFDDLVLIEVLPGRGFHERSSMLSMRTWEHERWIERADGGCDLHDRLTFEPRIAGTGPLLRMVVRHVFEHRHRRLRRRFGGWPAEVSGTQRR